MAVQRIDRGDLWKNKVRALQLQLRDRFRVAVDRHRRRRHRPQIFAADGSLSTAIQRWLGLFRDFRRDALPSASSAFYRKRGQPVGLTHVLRFECILFVTL